MINGNVLGIGSSGKDYKVYGIDIDQSNSNPSTCCTYSYDSIFMSAGSSEWDDVFGCRPCLFVDGEVSVYLNKNNFAQDEDGNAVDITTLGNDVMIEFPKMGYKITTEGNIIHVRLTDEPDADGYCYKPFSRATEGDRDYFYYGAYKSYSSGDKLYSSSGKTPTANKTRATYRAEARARGTGYAQNGWYQLIYLQILYLLKYKNLNSQTALGYGYVSSSHTACTTTGNTNAKGFSYGSSDQNLQMKFLGIEDMWGNIWQWVDGLTTDASYNMVTTHTPANFDDATSGTDHTVTATGISANTGGWVNSVQGTTDKGFALKTVGGSETTYLADYGDLYASCVAIFGGSWYYASYAGVFQLNVYHASSATHAGVASRLMYV